MSIKKASVNILFIFIDLIAVSLIAFFSIDAIQDLFPLFKEHLVGKFNILKYTNSSVALLMLYLMALLYTSGLYKNKINLSIKSHIAKTFTAIAIAYTSLFIYLFGFYNLFSLEFTWQTFIKVVSFSFIAINLPHLILIIIFRVLLHKGYISFRTIVFCTKERSEFGRLTGNTIVETIEVSNIGNEDNGKIHPNSSFNKIFEIINRYHPEEIIIALKPSHEKMVTTIVSIGRMKNITIKLLPDMESILKGFVRIDKLVAPPFVVFPDTTLPVWQTILKRLLDIFIALVCLCILLPFIPFIAYRIKKDSDGPIFYKQERIGKNSKPFYIFKFRTMAIDAEINGPSLSSSYDARVTTYGRFLRRWRIDEIPQFINVLRGDMAIVGPRPERSYYIDKIIEQAPEFSRTLLCKPGITSLGMVKYGYAENVDQMIKRLNYDIIYMDNLSLWLDIKILLFTFKTLLSGEGK